MTLNFLIFRFMFAFTLKTIIFEISANECGTVQFIDPKITRGTYVSRGAWPFLAALYYIEQSTFFCGGTLISAKHVLTAAHCVQFKSSLEKLIPKDVAVLLGAYNLDVRIERHVLQIGVEEINVHPDWKIFDDRYDADLAVFVLSDIVEFTNYIRPICIPDDNIPFDAKGSIVGWGLSEITTAREHEVMPRHTFTTLLNDSYCYTSNRFMSTFSSTRIFCGGGEGGSPNKGDSGGGLFVQSGSSWVQYGIISASFSDVSDLYSLYTNVKMFKNWIGEIVRRTGSAVMTNGENNKMKINLRCRYDSPQSIFYICHLLGLNIIQSNLLVNDFTGTHISSFSSQNVSIIRSNTGYLKYIPDGVGLIFNNIYRIYFNYMGLRLLKRTNFKNMNLLWYLDVSNNDIDTVYEDTLRDLSNLKNFVIYNNKLKVLHRHTFEKNTRLVLVNANSNQLEYLHRNLFTKNHLLEEAHFKDNHLMTIYIDFTQLKIIKNIDFQGNICINEALEDINNLMTYQSFFHNCSDSQVKINKVSANYAYECATADIIDSKMTLGSNTTTVPWPFLAALYNIEQSKFFCGGTLISSKHVLSAAHCVKQKTSMNRLTPKDVAVLLGAYNLNVRIERNVQQREVEVIYIHPDWLSSNKKYDADLTILVLIDIVEFTKFIRPICMPDNDVAFDAKGSIIGWGLSENLTTTINQAFPQRTVSNVLNLTFCYTTDLYIASFSSTRMFCGDRQNGPLHKGDSGGGFFVLSGSSWVQYGISTISDVSENVMVNSYSFYTNVHFFKNWIEETVRKSRSVVMTIGQENKVKIEFRCTYFESVRPKYYRCVLWGLNVRYANFVVDAFTGTHLYELSDPDVTEVWFWEGTFEFVPDGIGLNFNHLEKFIVGNNTGLKLLKRSNFKNMELLWYLDLSSNDIETLDEDTLRDLSNLKYFMIAYNKLKTLHTNTFEENTNLLVVKANSNHLESLPDDLFKNNLLLEEAYFQDNKLTTISIPFSQFRLVKKIDFQGNICTDTNNLVDYQTLLHNCSGIAQKFS